MPTIDEVRRIALEAAARGWLDPVAIWSIALRAVRAEGEVSVEEILSECLGPEKLGALLGSGDETVRQSGQVGHPSAPYEDGTEVVGLDAEPPGPLAPRGTPGRYEVGEQLGKGGVGTVHRAVDHAVGRAVAIKTLRDDAADDPSLQRRFLTEARITAQLEHPGIIPIHDVGVLPDGRVFYSMRIVGRRSLRDVLRGSREGWPLFRLCGTFVLVCRAMAYAHAQGVIHRDLKPGNVLIGEYGEVYVADWGIAKQLGATEANGTRLPRGPSADTGVDAQLGTPGYMSPEQARGDWKEVDHRADLFALGTILYEILAGTPPFRRGTVEDTLAATLLEEPPRPRELVQTCPLVLEDLCLRLLAKRPEARPASAEEVAGEVEAFLEGAKERARRRQEADLLATEARASVERAFALGHERDRLLAEARALLRDVRPWDPIEKKRAGWAREAEARTTESDRAMAFAEAVELYSQALGHDPEHDAARAGLAEIYWSRAVEATEERKEPTRLYYESLVREFDDVGRYAALLVNEARVTIVTDPPGARVRACRFVERDRVLVPSDERLLGETPLVDIGLPAGTYLFLLDHPACRATRHPLHCRRGSKQEVRVRLRTDREIGEGFVYVPGGVSIVGGDIDAVDPLPRQEASIGDFAISRFPVTFDEYLAFVDSLREKDPVRAEKRMPQDRVGQGHYALPGPEGRLVVNYDLLVEGDAKAYCPPERVGDLPVLGIDWYDARAYCRWLSERLGASCRLPSDYEWERAARGADGRLFPWGNAFDATFCKMGESRPGLPQPEPVGAFPVDESPFGVRDLAGGSADWVSDVEGDLATLEAADKAEPTVTPRPEDGWSIIRGGAWTSREPNCRTTSRRRAFTTLRLSVIGFRVAKDLPR